MKFLATLWFVFTVLAVALTARGQARSIVPEPAESVVANNAVARLPDGTVLLLVPPGQLRVSRTPHPVTLDDFAEPIRLFGEAGVLSRDKPTSIAMAVAGDKIHVVSCSGKRLEWHITSVPISKDAKWQDVSLDLDENVRIDDLATDGQAVFAVYCQTLNQGQPWRIGVAAAPKDGKITTWKIAEGADPLFAARAACGGEAVLELVWTRSEVSPRIYHARLNARSGEVEAADLLHDGMHADILSVNGRTFIASEAVNGAIQVEWREGQSLRGTQRLEGLAIHRPALAADEHGVVWLFAAASNQRGLFYRRFLGSGFGPEFQCAGAPGAWLQSVNYSVQPFVAKADDGFAILAGEYVPEKEYRYRLHNLPVPRYSVTDDRRVLFLDMLEVAEIEDVQQRPATAVRCDANPLDLNGPPGSPDAAWVNYPTVLYDQGKFRMWYSTNTNSFERNMNIAYAESVDGIHWTKPALGLVEFNGSKKNNMVFPNLSGSGQPSGYNAAVTLIVRDDLDQDAQRRYKMVFESSYEKGTSVYMSWSPNGIEWHVPPQRLWGKSPGPNKAVRGFHPWHEPLSSFFYDPITPRSEYRWKIYGQDAYAGFPYFNTDKARNLSMVHGSTPYAFAGHEGNPVLDARTGHQEDQIHGGMVQPYHGLYLCLYQHWSGPDWRVDLRLAASRDGIHFARVHPDHAVLPLGAPGQWDSGMLCTPNAVFVHDGKVWLYYRGSIGTLATGRAMMQSADEQPQVKAWGEAWRMKAGLARLREDGFTYLTVRQMERIAGTGDYNEVPKYHQPLRGRVVTIPIDAAGIEARSLHANVGNMAPGFAWLRARLRDAGSGVVIAGYDFDDCDPVDAASLDHKFSWKGSPDLARVTAKRVRVEFQLFGNLDSPQLYSFWFAPK